ncbi:MAG: hypothetical protein ABSE19_09140 [Candidatus Acidiferrum sp.]|jgi:hypothetical protein
MSEHRCEFDMHHCSSSDCDVYWPCDKPASLKLEVSPGRWEWLCAEHYDYLVSWSRKR